MSPNEYNEDIFSLRERETIVTDIRSSYSFIFNQLVQIYKFHHQDEKLSTKAEEVADAVETLHNEGKITDYLYEKDGATLCEDSTDCRLDVTAGERLSVVRRLSDRTLAKKKGVTGWYFGRLAETPEKDGR